MIRIKRRVPVIGIHAVLQLIFLQSNAPLKSVILITLASPRVNNPVATDIIGTKGVTKSPTLSTLTLPDSAKNNSSDRKINRKSVTTNPARTTEKE